MWVWHFSPELVPKNGRCIGWMLRVCHSFVENPSSKFRTYISCVVLLSVWSFGVEELIMVWPNMGITVSIEIILVAK